LLGRGHVGDGHIDNRRLVDAAYAAGYHGYVEVEIFNEEIWSAPGEQTVATVVERHRQAFG
jgi:sugar phosphate isomerase/epimerase